MVNSVVGLCAVRTVNVDKTTALTRGDLSDQGVVPVGDWRVVVAPKIQ